MKTIDSDTLRAHPAQPAASEKRESPILPQEESHQAYICPNMPAYAHTLKDQPKEQWEPLFTSFGHGPDECQQERCEKCANLEANHGHLNKVAYWSAKFAAEISKASTPDSASTLQVGYSNDDGRNTCFRTYRIY